MTQQRNMKIDNRYGQQAVRRRKIESHYFFLLILDNGASNNDLISSSLPLLTAIMVILKGLLHSLPN